MRTDNKIKEYVREMNINVFKRMQNFDLYQRLDNKVIKFQDRIDDIFCEDDLFNLTSCTLVYHQLIECMMNSLIIHFVYLDELLSDKISNENSTRIDGFAKTLEKVKEIDNIEFFKEKDEFIEECYKINKLRNVLAHEIIKCDENEIIRRMNEVKNIYHSIQHMYQTIAIRIFNFIHNDIDDFSVSGCF